jgi:DNA-binding LacI/PurR family transcriptional regulator
VSTATVSRVLNDNYYVSPDLKASVMKAISELNYTPNAIARWLKNESTHIIGYVVSDISNNYFTTLVNAVEKKVNKYNYSIIIFNCGRNPKKELSYLQLLMKMNVDGIIINTTGGNDDYLAYISQTIPVVSLSRRIQSQKYAGDFIDSNNYEGGYQLTNHLISKGHTQIGVINGDLNLSSGQERFNGFQSCLKDRDINPPDEFIYAGDFTSESGYLCAQYLFSLASRPTAIIAMNNSMALGAMKYFIDNSISVPEDIILTCYGNIDNIDLLRIKPIYVTLDPVTIGNKCGELLLNRIENPALPIQQIIYEPRLIIQ